MDWAIVQAEYAKIKVETAQEFVCPEEACCFRFVLPEDPLVPNPDYPPEPPIGEPGEPEPIINPVPPGGPG